MISSQASLATFLDATILSVAFRGIRRTFATTDPSTRAWVLNAYMIVFAAPRPETPASAKRKT